MQMAMPAPTPMTAEEAVEYEIFMKATVLKQRGNCNRSVLNEVRDGTYSRKIAKEIKDLLKMNPDTSIAANMVMPHGRDGKTLEHGSVRQDAYYNIIVWGLRGNRIMVNNNGTKVRSKYSWDKDHICPDVRIIPSERGGPNGNNMHNFQPLQHTSNESVGDNLPKRFIRARDRKISSTRFMEANNTLVDIERAINNADAASEDQTIMWSSNRNRATEW